MPDRGFVPGASLRVVLGLAILVIAGRAEARSPRTAAVAAPRATVRHGDVLRLPVAQAHTRGSARAEPPAPSSGVTVYLDRHGGLIEGGVDDAAGRQSWIAASAPGGSVTIPAWAGGLARWQRVVACVRAGFGPLAVEVVDEQPDSDDFTLIMVGGTPELLGYGDSVAGIAPSATAVLRRAVGFVFSANLDSQVEATCESALHEIGHTLGLDHSYACGDLMSYEACGAKRFVDAELPCGESEARACDDGLRTQNSWRHLVDAVGLAPGRSGAPASGSYPGRQDEAEPEPGSVTDADAETDSEPVTVTVTESEPEPVTVTESEPEPEPVTESGSVTDSDSDSDPVTESEPETVTESVTESEPETVTESVTDSDPDSDSDPVTEAEADADGTVAIVGLADTVAGNRWLPIDIEAHAAAGVDDVALAWSQGEDQHAWVCSEPVGADGVTCERQGDLFRFWIPAGVGSRQLVAIARDHAGHVITSEARAVELVDADAHRTGRHRHHHSD